MRGGRGPKRLPRSLGRTRETFFPRCLVRRLVFRTRASRLALHPEQFDFKDQRGVRWYHAACTARSIAEFRWNDEGALAADLHGGDAFVPAGDHPFLSDRKFERLAAVERRVELLAFGAILI